MEILYLILIEKKSGGRREGVEETLLYYCHQYLDVDCNNSAQDCIGFTLRLLQLSELIDLTRLFEKIQFVRT